MFKYHSDMGHCFSYVVVVSKESKKKMFVFFCFVFYFSFFGKDDVMDMVLGKKIAIFDWEWGRNSGPRDGQKIP